MRGEVKQFFAGYNLPIERMVAVGTSRRSLDANAIRKAAEVLYDEIQNGREYRPIRLSWIVYDKARFLKIEKDTEIDNRIAELEAALGWYKKPLTRIIWEWNRRPVK